MLDDFDELQDGLYDFNHDGKLDDFEKNAQLYDSLQFLEHDENDSSYKGTFHHRGAKKNIKVQWWILILAFILQFIPGCGLIGTILVLGYLYYVIFFL
ncbi:MAG: hypothetical protein E7282_09515 [Lachnospiraceae bacterium]|nr:hypothetical protein [Lachnospiraceae bacterium]